MPDTGAAGFGVWVNGFNHWKCGGICAGLGAVAALGLAPWGLWPLTLLALAAIYLIFASARDWKQAAFIGWCASTGYFLLALSWIVEPFLVDAPRHGWMAPFALIFLSGGLALFWSVGFAVARRIGGAGAWVALIVLSEAARGWLFTGFPWAQPGHVWIDTAMLHWAGIAGPHGLTLMTAVAAVGLAWLFGRRFVAGAVLVAAVAALFGAGARLWPAPVPLEDRPIVRLVQPNAAQNEKWNPDKALIFYNRQIRYTARTPRPDLVVWPETSVPQLLNHAQPALADIARAANGVPVVFGIQRFEGARFYNSLVALGPDGQQAALYDKHHLVPFGEYIPFGDMFARFGIRGFAAQEGNGYSPGPGPHLIDLGALGRALPLICYEGVFARDLNAAPARADFLLMITNDAWFGTVSGPYQHFAQARLRSAERGLPMIRVANTGISGVIDGTGRVVQSYPLGEAGAIDVPLPAPLAPTRYAKTGDFPILMLMFALALASGLYSRRNSGLTPDRQQPNQG